MLCFWWEGCGGYTPIDIPPMCLWCISPPPATSTLFPPSHPSISSHLLPWKRCLKLLLSPTRPDEHTPLCFYLPPSPFSGIVSGPQGDTPSLGATSAARFMFYPHPPRNILNYSRDACDAQRVPLIEHLPRRFHDTPECFCPGGAMKG